MNRITPAGEFLHVSDALRWLAEQKEQSNVA
jgi:hypothetical protein